MHYVHVPIPHHHLLMKKFQKCNNLKNIVEYMIVLYSKELKSIKIFTETIGGRIRPWEETVPELECLEHKIQCWTA